ncbi:MAG: flagellar basal-body MS-ring/collar protein FliF [Hydrogenophaga sp.]|uniref:flagellar basal-body MS-ring/collar protein FliF n=1 Tax=Hydrogenophaga sp. TaxID=1904254 RepID=UPI00261FA4AA|nr:flagellar basal-body MS-ring/collar protein FliF [Hydrogenophaga sp.]MDM7942407.1 flagellar basal-body MS-ring/collar protein FliF [Hydrogenophaga sp.]
MNDAIKRDPSEGGTTLSLSEATPANPSAPGAQAGLSQRLVEAKQRVLALSLVQKLLLGSAVVFLLAIVMSMSLSGSIKDDYRVLFSNVSERDGAAIIAALQQQNVPYRFTEGGGAILVPGPQVHETRLRLAGQGLPKGGSVGFELLENQKLGTSQFVEQINYQRGLEGELAKTIQSLTQVKAARVHVAIPKSSAFSRDAQRPTASVVLDLHPGRFLDDMQVIAMTNLVSSSVPMMSAQSVTVMDGEGNLLAPRSSRLGELGLDVAQLKYVAEVEAAIAKRIAAIVEPVTGRDNVRAQVTVDMDFSQVDRTEETFRPNSTPEKSAIRSERTLEAEGPISTAGGIPGALSNQPPQPVATPLEADPPTQQGEEAPETVDPPGVQNSNASRREATTNYEVDRSIQTTKQGRGLIKRVSAAVMVNHRSGTDAAGQPLPGPYSPDEIRQITQTVRDAMGFNPQRGDSVSVANFPFNVAPVVETPLWQDGGFIEIAKEAIKLVLLLGLLGIVFFSVVRPMLFPPPPKPVDEAQQLEDEMDEKTRVELSALLPQARERRLREIELDKTRRQAEDEERRMLEDADRVRVEEERRRQEEDRLRQDQEKQREYEELMLYAKEYVTKDPRVVASVFKEWLSDKAEAKA